MEEANKTNPGFIPGDPFFEQEMFNLEDLDLEIELASLTGEDNGWNAANILDNIGSPPPFHSLYDDFDQLNLTSEGQEEEKDMDSSYPRTFPTNENMEPTVDQAAAIISGTNMNGAITATQDQAQTIEPPSNNENSSNYENSLVDPTHFMNDPNSLTHPSLPISSAPLLNETTTTPHSSPSVVELVSEIAGLSIQDQDMEYFRQFSHIHGVLGMANQQSINNPMLMPNMMGSNDFSGINHHIPSPYPALCYVYPVQVGVGTGHSSGQFNTNQRLELQNNITTPQISKWAPNSFTPLLHQNGQTMGMQKIYDLQQPQNYLQAAYPIYPKNTPQQVHLHPGSTQVQANKHSHHQHRYSRPNAFGLVPPNPHHHTHQHAYNRPMMPQPANPSLYHVPCANENANNNNHYNPQATLLGGHRQQGLGSLQFKVSQGLPVQRQSQQGTRRTLDPEGSSSQDSNSPLEDEYARLLSLFREEKDPGVQKEQLMLTNVVTNQRDKGKGKLLAVDPSTPRQPSAAIRRILNMNPKRIVTSNFKQNYQTQNLPRARTGDWKAPIAGPLNLTPVAGQEQIQKPRRGRPPKRRGPIQIYCSSKLQVRKTSGEARSREADGNVQNEVQSTNPTGPPLSDSSVPYNGVYDMGFAKIGLPIDPFLRCQAFQGK